MDPEAAETSESRARSRTCAMALRKPPRRYVEFQPWAQLRNGT